MERPMNTASKDRTVQATILDFIKSSDKRHTPVTRIKVNKDKNGQVDVQVYTSKPEVLRMESTEMASVLQEDSGRDVKVTIVPEARAVAKYVRMSPRKVRFVIAAIKGKRVTEALDLLRFIPNHASEPLSKVIQSAAANAQESWGAGPDELKVANIIADGGPILKRIRPRAQGRAYRILKRTSHITAILLETPPAVRKKLAPAKPKAKKPAPPARAPKAQTKVAEPVVEEQIVTPAVEEETVAPVIEAASSSAPETIASAEVLEPEAVAVEETTTVVETEESGAEPQESTAEAPTAEPEGEPEAAADGEKA